MNRISREFAFHIVHYDFLLQRLCIPIRYWSYLVSLRLVLHLGFMIFLLLVEPHALLPSLVISTCFHTL